MKTLTVDDYNRVRLPDVKPRQVIAHEKEAGGRIILTPVEPVAPKAAKVRFEKRGGYTVGVIEGVEFNETALKQEISEFP